MRIIVESTVPILIWDAGNRFLSTLCCGFQIYLHGNNIFICGAEMLVDDRC
jgi:hypothetical protein